MKKGRKQILSGGFELDWVNSSRRYVHNWGSGVGKYIKRRMNKRERRSAKEEIKKLN